MTYSSSACHIRHDKIKLKLATPSAIILIILTAILSASCTNGTDQVKGFASVEDALADYRSYNASIAGKTSASTKELAEIVTEWREVSDNVSMMLVSDTVPSEKNSEAYFAISDSIEMKIAELVDSRKRSLADYIQLVGTINKPELDSISVRLVDAVHKFYGNLDNTPTFEGSGRAVIKTYESILDDALKSGFSDKKSVFDFLVLEDKAFRSFLEHLPELGNIPLTDIRDNTADAIGNIVELARNDDALLDPEEVVILLTMRNNRRLLQNALQCVNDINSGRIKSEAQKAAYLWMLMQPWLSFDTFAYSLMSEAQMNTMKTLSTETSKCVKKIGGFKDFPIDIDELPSLLIKTVVLGHA